MISAKGLFKKLIGKKPEFLIKPDHQWSVAFVQNGIEYNQFTDPFNIPCSRGLCALDYYKKLKMGCDDSFLEEHTDAMDTIFNDPYEIRVGKAAMLNLQLRERIRWVKPIELYLDLASVLYWDKTENPLKYDYDYGRVKIERWKQDWEVLDFFLSQHMSNLLPSLKQSNLSSREYFDVVNKAHQIHMDALQSVLSSRGSKSANEKN